MQEQWSGRLGKTARTFIDLLPIVIGMLLLTSLGLTLCPAHLAAGLGHHPGGRRAAMTWPGIL